MKTLFKLFVLLICVTFAFLATSDAFAIRHTCASILDFDGTDGYTGDFCMIYNPVERLGGSLSVGTLSGLIRTDIDSSYPGKTTDGIDDASVSVVAPYAGLIHTGVTNRQIQYRECAGHEIGETRSFEVYDFNDDSTFFIPMCVAGIGKHCYIWESTDPSYYPLSQYSDTAIKTFITEFDKNCEKTTAIFGDFADIEGTGRVNILMYDIGADYVAGYFYDNDLYGDNGAAIIHVDTYPNILSEDEAGHINVNIDDSMFGTVVHEFQHLITTSRSIMYDVDYPGVWVDEMLSCAAEEVAYPGSSLRTFAYCWGDINDLTYTTNDNGEYILVAPKEFNATDVSSHTGRSMYNNSMVDEDMYYSYARVTLFGQYLYSQYGSTEVFARIVNALRAGKTIFEAVPEAMKGTRFDGKTMSDIVLAFRLACVVNDSDSLDGLYGFTLPKGFDPDDNIAIGDPYNLVPIGVYTGAGKVKIAGGGFMVVKPTDGVFYPPKDADSGLVYVGIRVYGLDKLETGDVNADGVVNTGDAVLVLKYTVADCPLADVQKSVADMNGDKAVNTGDATAILIKVIHKSRVGANCVRPQPKMQYIMSRERANVACPYLKMQYTLLHENAPRVTTYVARGVLTL